MKISKELLTETYGLPYSYDCSLEHDVEVIEDKVIGNSRWSIQHSLIFRVADNFYRAKYSVAATECQDEGPWEYEEEVEITPVHQVEKTILVWEAL